MVSFQISEMANWELLTDLKDIESSKNYNHLSIYENHVLQTYTSTSAASEVSISVKKSEDYYGINLSESIYVFSVEDNKLQLRKTFKSTVDCFCIYKNLIVIALKDGHIYGISLLPRESTIFVDTISNSKLLKNESPKSNFTNLTYCKTNGIDTFYLVSTFDVLYKIVVPDLDNLLESLLNQDDSAEEQCYIASHEKIHLKNGFTTVDTFGNEMFLYGENLAKFYLENSLEEKVLFQDFSFTIKKILKHPTHNFLLGVTNLGCLISICIHTYNIFNIWQNEFVEDFTIFHTNSEMEPACIALLTRNVTSKQIVLLNLDNFQEVFRQTVDNFICFANFIKHEIFYVENSPNFDRLQIKVITKNVPELKLKRYIQLEQYDEAIEFAEKFQLNVEIVYKAQVKNFVKQIHKLNQFPQNNDLLKKFLYCINNINDIEFVCNNCIQIMPFDLSLCEELLSVTHARLMNYLEKNDCNANLSKLMVTVNDIDIRTQLYKKIHGSETESKHWKIFLKTSILQILVKYLQSEKMKFAILVFQDTKHLLLKENPKNTVKILLEATPDCLILDNVLPWYQLLIPTALQYNSTVIEDIINFVYNKLILFEKGRCEKWPQTGIEFTQAIINMFDTNHDTENLYNSFYTNINQSISWNKLLDLLRGLQLALELKQNHNIFLPLDICLVKDPELIASKILDREQTDNVVNLFKNFMRQFASQRQFDCDLFLLNYINEVQKNYMKKNAELNIKQNNPNCSRWEDFMIVLIKQVSNPKYFADSVMHLFKISTVPWSDEVTSFFHEVKQMGDKSLADQLDIIFLCSKIQEILDKYAYKLNLSCIKKDAMQLIRRIIKFGKPNEIVKDVLIVANNFNIKEWRYQMPILLHFIKQNAYVHLSEYLNELSTENCLELCNGVLFIMSSILNTEKWNEYHISMSSHIYNVLPLIQRRIEIAIKSNSFTDYKSEISNLKSIYELRSNFNYYTNTENFSQKNHRVSILFELLSKTNITERLLNLAELLALTKEEVLVHAIQFIPLPHFLDLISNLLEEDAEMNEKKSLFYSQIALKLMTMKMDKGNENILTSLDAMNKYLNVIDQLISSTCLTSNVFNELHYWGFIFDSIRPSFFSTKSLSQQKCFLSKWRFTPIYKDVINSSNFVPVFNCVKKTFECFLQICSIVMNGRMKKALNLPEFNIEMLNNLLQQLAYSIKKLKTFDCHLILLHIITTFCNLKYSDNVDRLPNSNTLFSKMQKLAFELITTILNKIITREIFDSGLAFTLALTLNTDDAKNWFSSAAQQHKTDVKKLQFIHQTYLAYCAVRLPASIEHAKKLNLQTKWMQKFSEANISHANVFDTSLPVLSTQIMLNGSLEMLMDFINDFKLKRLSVLLDYFELIFLNWNPDMDYIQNNNSEMVNNYIQSLFDKCLNVISLINDDSIIIQQLNLIRKKINIFNYEAYICLIKVQKEFGIIENNNKCDILLFLTTYKRLNPPGEYEKKFINQDEKKVVSIDNYRLPMNILFSENRLEILRFEINVNNYQRWETIIDKLNIDRHKFYVFVIKCTVRGAEWQRVDSNTKWSSFPKNNKLLYQIEECARKITDWKTSLGSLFYVVNNTPPGADLMEAARLCYNYSQENTNQNDSFCTQKVVEKYIEISVKHILYTNDLESCIKDNIEPEQLLRALYQDKYVLENVKSPQIKSANINKVAQQISAVYKIDFNSFCFSFVNELLQKADENVLDVEDTMNITTNFLNRNSEKKDSNLQIICYILKSQYIAEENAIIYLYNMAFNDNLNDLEETNIGNMTFTIDFSCNTNSNAGTKLRALMCLLSIADEEKINQIMKSEAVCMSAHMRELWFLHQLERLGIFFSMDKFKNYDKNKLIKEIWDENYHLPLAVAVIGTLMYEYKMKSYQLWTQTIEQMIKFKMMKELRYFLPRILDIISRNSTIYKRAAELLI